MQLHEEGDASHQGRKASPRWHGEELQQLRSQMLSGTARFERWDDALAALRAELREHRGH